MKKLCQILVILLVAIFILPQVYSSEIIRVDNVKLDKSFYKPTKNEILELIKREENSENWYGIYLGGEKIGWASGKVKIYESDKFDQEVMEIVYKYDLSQKEPSNDGNFFISNGNISFTEIYQTSEPFKLIVNYEEYQKDDTTSSVFGKNKGGNFKLEYKDNNKKNIREILLTNFNYSLYDYFTINAWLAHKTPNINDVVSSITFDFQTLKYILTKNSIEEIVKKKISGVDFTYYKINSLVKSEIEEENLLTQVLIDQDGREIKFSFGDTEFRLETEKNAKNVDVISDIFVDLGIKVENSFPVDFSDKVSSMVIYEVIGDGSSISNKGHQDYKTLESGIKILTVGTDENQKEISLMESATIEQRKYYLNNFSTSPHKSKIIIDLSKEAIAGEKKDIKKIFKLAKFVSDYVVDDYESNSISVFDVIDRKKGDCTEHTQLFVNLARAAGFSTREVGGWVYGGTDILMPHAWAEVAVQVKDDFFVWIPVDPTFNFINPTNVIKEINDKFLPKFTLKIRKILYDNGEVVLY